MESGFEIKTSGTYLASIGKFENNCNSSINYCTQNNYQIMNNTLHCRTNIPIIVGLVPAIL